MVHEMRMSYYEYVRKHNPVKGDMVFFDSHDSFDLGGNLYYIAREILSGKYGKFKMYISVRNLECLPQNICLLQRDFPSSGIKLVLRDSMSFFRAMAVAKYLFADVQLSIFFVKRPGQVVVQTWHGTPLKKLGYSYAEDVACTGGQKKTFMAADYNLFPNEYTMQNIRDSYRLRNNLTGSILLNGYPRNAVFFDTDAAQRVRKRLVLEDKRVYVYMPTWRGSLFNLNSSKQQIKLLQRIDESLCPDQVFYVKLHRLVSQEIDFSEFHQVRPVPQDMETYEFLAAADCLITDYSSVMFDFLCTRKKIILYAYDKEAYLQSQGTYISMDELPFPQVTHIDQLIDEMAEPKRYDDSEAYARFCSYDSGRAAEQLCDKVIRNDDSCREIVLKSDQKQNILLYGGNLQPNCGTQRFVFYLDDVERRDENYCVAYKNTDFIENSIRLQAVTSPHDLQSLECWNGVIGNETLKERKWKSWLYKGGRLNRRMIKKAREYAVRTFEQQFYGKRYDKVIAFPDTPIDVMELFLFSDVEEKVFYVDSEMLKDDKRLALVTYAKEQGCEVKEEDSGWIRPGR